MKQLDFVGNKRVIEQLGALIDSKRFPHALIIEGEQGLGKKTLARLLASALVCRSEDKPCMQCTQCHKAKEHIHPDIFEHTATGGANSFHVSVVRDVINDVYMKPNEAEFKVYILGNAHCMNASAQNALLKVLEEPPSYAVFILTVESKSMMLETVLSRSVVVSLEGVDIDEGASYMLSHFDDIDKSSAKSNLEVFNGNIGKALDGVTQGRTGELTNICIDLCNALVEDNEYSLVKTIAPLQNDRQGIVFVMELMKNIFRDALVNTNDYISGQTATITMLKNKVTRQKFIDLIGICDKLKEMALMNTNNALLLTKICYSLRQAIGR